MIKRCWLLLAVLCAAVNAEAQDTENVFLITFDGLRWQEVFAGADSSLIRDEYFTGSPDAMLQEFWAPTAAERREKLMPFFWTTIAAKGQLYGNRSRGCRMDVSNGGVFSYPGYNEILTGRADDDRIMSNEKRHNPNETILELANHVPRFEGRVAAFGSWDVFPYIINEVRSGVPVNAGFEPARGPDVTEKERLLNTLQQQIPSPWESVRLDAFTHHYAIETLHQDRPKFLYVAYGETDDFAHDGDFDAYLTSAHRTDAFIEELWTWVQSQEDYRDKTTLVITTDHGRGFGSEWTDHGADVDGARAVWLAVLGPNTPAAGEVDGPCDLYQNQVAATVARLLDIPSPENAGAPVERAYASDR